MPKLRITAAGRLRVDAAGRLALAETGSGQSPASAITVADFADRRVFQRLAGSRNITVAGTYSGSPSAIQARAVPHGTSLSSVAVAWTTIVSAPTGGTYTGTLAVPQGGWYKIQVRDAAATVAAAGNARWGVGIVVASVGQSNEENAYGGSAVWPSGDARAVAYIAGGWNRVGNQADSFPAGSPYTTYGGAYTTGLGSIDGDALVYLMNRLVAANNCPVAVLPYAVGGSTMAQWQPGSGIYWAPFAAAVAAAGGDFEAAWILQGESDSGGDMAAYKAGLAALRAGLLSITGRSASALPFGVIPLGPCTPAWRATEGFGAVRQAHLEFVAGSPNTAIVNAALDAPLGDAQVHYTVAGLSRKARRVAEWVNRALAGTIDTMQGPVITGATRAGAVVTVTVAHHGGSALVDGEGGAGAALQGWDYRDGAGNAVAITATAIDGASTIRLTLASAVAGTLRYAMSNLTFGSATPAAAAICYDNQVVPGDTLGVPLQPKAAFAVA